MKYYYIYKITNKINHKIYYGQHTTSNLNDGYMGSGIALHKAFKKYGIENFEKKILKFYNSPEELNIVEARLVNERWLKKNKNRTYNLQTGGNHRILSDESKKKISESLKGKPNLKLRGRHQSKEHKRKLSESRKGRIPWNKGKRGIYSEEYRRKISEKVKELMNNSEVKNKISEAKKGKKFSEEHKRKISSSIKKWHQNKNLNLKKSYNITKK